LTMCGHKLCATDSAKSIWAMSPQNDVC
jgi:hypothetical protein